MTRTTQSVFLLFSITIVSVIKADFSIFDGKEMVFSCLKANTEKCELKTQFPIFPFTPFQFKNLQCQNINSSSNDYENYECKDPNTQSPITTQYTLRKSVLINRDGTRSSNFRIRNDADCVIEVSQTNYGDLYNCATDKGTRTFTLNKLLSPQQITLKHNNAVITPNSHHTIFEDEAEFECSIPLLYQPAFIHWLVDDKQCFEYYELHRNEILRGEPIHQTLTSVLKVKFDNVSTRTVSCAVQNEKWTKIEYVTATIIKS